MKKVELFVFIVILSVILNAVYTYLHKNKIKKTKADIKTVNRNYIKYNDKNLTQDLVVNYIVNVINNGSNRLGFQKEGMDGGYVPKDKANDVACYVYELSGKKCNKSYAKDASLYFSSNCAGCHGRDGKGLNGTYPDLTKYPLQGLMPNK